MGTDEQRKAAWAEWNAGKAISDANLTLVFRDLETLEKIARASGQGGYFLLGVAHQLESVRLMYQARTWLRR